LRLRFQFRQHQDDDFEHSEDSAPVEALRDLETERSRRRHPQRQGQEPVVTVSAPEVQLQQRRRHHQERPLAPLEELQRDLEELLEARPDNPFGTEGDQSVGCGVFHFRNIVGAVLHPELVTGAMFGVRQGPRQLGGAVGDVVGLRQFDGESDLLHNIQQGLPAGFQEGADVQVPKNRMEAAQVTGESEDVQMNVPIVKTRVEQVFDVVTIPIL
jgi:hypothetical protein